MHCVLDIYKPARWSSSATVTSCDPRQPESDWKSSWQSRAKFQRYSVCPGSGKKRITRQQRIQDHKNSEKKIKKGKTVKESDGDYLIISWDKLLGPWEMKGPRWSKRIYFHFKSNKKASPGFPVVDWENWISKGQKSTIFLKPGRVDSLVRIGSPEEIEETIFTLGVRQSIAWRSGEGVVMRYNIANDEN